MSKSNLLSTICFMLVFISLLFCSNETYLYREIKRERVCVRERQGETERDRKRQREAEQEPERTRAKESAREKE